MATNDKGSLLEELLRKYFLSLGYYVVRGVRVTFNASDVTDVDLLLFSKSGPLKRSRTNVDIKNKRTPQAMERIVWAKGLQMVLGCDDCIVVTTDKRKDVSQYGAINNVSVIDGNFVSVLSNQNVSELRLVEEDFDKLFNIGKGLVTNPWLATLARAKVQISGNLDFNIANSLLIDLNYFIEQFMAFKSHERALCRAIYLMVSYVLLAIDFITSKQVSLDASDKKQTLFHGFRFGDYYESTHKILKEVLKSVENGEALVGRIEALMTRKDSKYNFDVLAEYFSSNKATSRLFGQARSFESLAFSVVVTMPKDLELEEKSVFAVLLDFFNIPRATLF